MPRPNETSVHWWVRKWITHPWKMRNHFKHPRGMMKTLRDSRASDRWKAEHGYGRLDEPPLDVWPQPIPKEMHFLVRCFCGELCYSAPLERELDGCKSCGGGGGFVLASRNFKPMPPPPPHLQASMDQLDAQMRAESKWLD